MLLPPFTENGKKQPFFTAKMGRGSAKQYQFIPSYRPPPPNKKAPDWGKSEEQFKEN